MQVETPTPSPPLPPCPPPSPPTPPSGDVLFWETTKGVSFRLPKRWGGLYLEGGGGALETQEAVREQARWRSAASAAAAATTTNGASRRRTKTSAAIAQEKAERTLAAVVVARAAANKKERRMLYDSEDELCDVLGGWRPTGTRTEEGAEGGGYERVIDSPYGTPRENWGDDSKDRREGMTDQQAFSNAPKPTPSLPQP